MSAPAPESVYSNQPVSLPSLSQVPGHLLTPKKCELGSKRAAQKSASSPEPVESAPSSPEPVEFTPVTFESVESSQSQSSPSKSSQGGSRRKRRAHIVQSNALRSEVPSTLVQEGLSPEVSDPLAQEGPSQVPPSSVVPEDPILMVPIPVVQEDQSQESSNPLVQEGLCQEAPSPEVQESLSQEVSNSLVQEDPTRLVLYPVVPEVYDLESTPKLPTTPAKPVLKESETAPSELFMRPVLSKVGTLISTVASTETVLDLAMEVIPEHLTLPVMATEATSEQQASPVGPTETNPVCHVMLSETVPVSATDVLPEHLSVPVRATEAILDVISSHILPTETDPVMHSDPVLALEVLPKHPCLPAKATETTLGLSSSLVITTETEPASHVTSSGSAPVTEAISGLLDLPAIATEATPELLASHDSPKDIISASFFMLSEVIPACQSTVNKSVTVPALCTSCRSDGTSETVYDVTLVQESSKLSSLPTSAVMAPELVTKHFPNQETASIRDFKSSWEFPPDKRPPISRGVTNRVPIPPSVLPGCHAPPKLPPFWAVPKYSPGLFSALPAPPPVFPGYTGPPIFPPQLVPPLSLIIPVLLRTPSPSVDAWRCPLEGGYCQGTA
ncbi:hypothetical protein G5714_023710 [Onychostoma macrolepis]|uniref:Uncharacterized protein n=1 Tax=Onychostoma macrolepis TaxID=369639 RepID=A0A7J6BM08_9TELE|nr:hypothetical protein G5714_023710 [Onychostoma macrolepis]